MFFASLIERRHLRPIEPLDDAKAPSSAKALGVHQELIDCGMLFLGVYRDGESNILKTEMSIYLSPDGRVMAMLPRHAYTLGYRVYSEFADGRLLVSGQVTGNGSVSGLRDQAMLPDCSVRQVLRFHLDRLSNYSQEAVPFSPETITDDLLARDRQEAEASVQQGLARWVDARQTIWVMTLAGAWRVAWGQLADFARLTRDNARAEEYKAEGDPRLDWEIEDEDAEVVALIDEFDEGPT
ncbi:MAG: hypothetical protein AAGB29_08355 [Planctomycetota bacterium]